MKAFTLFLALLMGAAASRGAGAFRTDINPAQRYYQAFLLLPDLPEADHKYLFVEEWRGRRLEPRFGELLALYDNTFKTLRQAAQARVPCDWGIDLSEGPNALLPGLANAKLTAQAARLRVMWHLQNGREQEALDDLLAAFILGRNVSKDGVLISALVQYAIENIIVSIVAENFYRFSPQALQELIERLETTPPHGTIVQCVATEKAGFYDWLLRKIDEVRKNHPNNEAEAYKEVAEVLRQMAGEEIDKAKFAAAIERASGGTIEGVVKLVSELEPLYPRVAEILVLPYDQLRPALRTFTQEVKESSNPLVPLFFTIYENCRLKQCAAEMVLAMLKAAVAYRTQGQAAFERVTDPCGDGPFGFRRFQFEGIDRGFELRSELTGRGFDEVLIFVEKEGPPFRLVGPNAGKPLPPPAEPN